MSEMLKFILNLPVEMHLYDFLFYITFIPALIWICMDS